MLKINDYSNFSMLNQDAIAVVWHDKKGKKLSLSYRELYLEIN